MISRLYRMLDRGLSLIETVILVLALVVSVAALIVDVTLRNTTGVALSWAAELTRYAIVWMVFVGGGVAAREGNHISIDVIGEILPNHLRKGLTIGSLVFSALASAVFAVISVKLVMQMFMFHQLSASLEIPMWWVYLAMPVGFGLMTLRFLQAAVEIASHDDTLVLYHISAS